MTQEESKILLDKIIKAMKAAVTKVYEEARRDGTELVISKKAGETQWIKVRPDGKIDVVRTEKVK